MTDTNWPDPNRPGVPLFPDVEGWHLMEGRGGGQTALAHWNGIEWGGGEQIRALNSSPEWYRYVGPVMSRAQIERQEETIKALQDDLSAALAQIEELTL